MVYGQNMPALFKHAATYVDKILKGATPADLPVEQPQTFDFVINTKTAKALGLSIPQLVLMQAPEVSSKNNAESAATRCARPRCGDRLVVQRDLHMRRGTKPPIRGYRRWVIGQAERGEALVRVGIGERRTRPR